MLADSPRVRRFQSILFGQREVPLTREPPAFFRDLNLDQVVQAMTAASKGYDVAPFFYTAIEDIETITYRQAIMRDLESNELTDVVGTFSTRMRERRAHAEHAAAIDHRYARARWLLRAVSIYCEAVGDLARDLDRLDLRSPGFRDFREALLEYLRSAPFQALTREAAETTSELSAVRYCVLVDGATVTVRPYDAEIDYSAEIEATFEKFRRGAAKDYRLRLAGSRDMSDVELRVLDRVARLNPEPFRRLLTFAAEHEAYVDEGIDRFDREVQFYLAYLNYLRPLREAGMPFCYPDVSRTSKAIGAIDAFDLALAGKRVPEKKLVVCNDFSLNGVERIVVVSGPNQGGKTTFARIFGQLHYLAKLGCAVPAAHARLFHFDRLFTHFERVESIESLRGKLLDDLVPSGGSCTVFSP